MTNKLPEEIVYDSANEHPLVWALHRLREIEGRYSLFSNSERIRQEIESDVSQKYNSTRHLTPPTRHINFYTPNTLETRESSKPYIH